MKRATLVLGVLVAGVAWALAQPVLPGARPPAPRQPVEGTLPFRPLGLAEDLPPGAITALEQDALGFVWVGTTDGLARLDGEASRIFRGASADTSALPSGVVQALAAGRGGALWVGTAAGLAHYDPARESMRRVPRLANVLALHADGVGGVWVGTTGGLARVLRSGTVQPVAEGQLPHPDVQALALAAGALWVGTGDGLARVDTATGSVRVFRPDGLAPASISALASTAGGALLVGTLGGGAFRFDPAAGTFRPLGDGASVVSSLRQDSDGAAWIGTLGGGLRQVRLDGSEVVYADSALPSTGVTALLDDRQGVLWVGTQSGLVRADRARGAYPRWRHDPAQPTSIASDDVRAIHVRGADVAVGTAAGLDLSDDGGRTFARASAPGGAVTAITYDDEGFVGGTDGGTVFRADDPDEPLARLGAPIAALVADADGALWAATLGRGLVRIAPGPPTRMAGLPSDTVRALAVDDRGVLWVATPAGLCRQSGQTAECRADLAGTDVRALLARPSQPRPGGEGELYAASAAGLIRVPLDGLAEIVATPETGLPGAPVAGLTADDEGFLWLATRAGFARFDPLTRTATRPAGSAPPLVGALAVGPAGQILAATARGVVVATTGPLPDRNPFAPQVALVGVDVQGQAVVPGPGAPLEAAAPVADELRLRPGEDYITIRFAALHFAAPARNTVRFQLVGFDDAPREGGLRREATYTNLDPGRYTFRAWATSAGGVTSEPAELAVVVLPPWWQTPWAVLGGALLVGLALVQGARVQQTRLLFRERERATRREAELRAETAEARRREAEAAAAALQADNDLKAAALDHTRRVEDANARLAAANARLQTSLEDLHAAQDRLVRQERLASLGQLTAGIAHEIKNPLNFITGFADLSVEIADDLAADLAAAADRPVAEVLPEVQDLLDDLRSNAARIRDHGHRTDRIVRSMLRLSRGDAAERTRVDANRFVDEQASLAYHGARVAGDGVAFRLDLDPDAGGLDVAEQDVGRVLINLVTNALQAVAERARAEPGHAPTVTVSTRRQGDALEIVVADNGPGIPDDLRARIFEPFFTTKAAGEGTGLGLSLAGDIVSLHGGTLTVESEVGAGATFTIRLPAADPPADA